MTDLHITSAGEYPHGYDSRQTFVTTLDLIERVQPIDMIVITGDIAHYTLDGSICSWVSLHLSSYRVPVYYTPGNHDLPDLLADTGSYNEGLKGGELFYSLQLDDRRYIFLDTSGHSVSDKQLSWLASVLADCSHTHKHPVIFMHHPPCPAGSLFMDRKYPFRGSEAFGEVLQIYNDVIPVFCGHYHIAKTIIWKNAVIHITPSTCFEVDPFSETFSLEFAPSGLRVIDITNDHIQSSVLRV